MDLLPHPAEHLLVVVITSSLPLSPSPPLLFLARLVLLVFFVAAGSDPGRFQDRLGFFGEVGLRPPLFFWVDGEIALELGSAVLHDFRQCTNSGPFRRRTRLQQ